MKKIQYIFIVTIIFIIIFILTTNVNAYQNHCWRCSTNINSNVNTRCSRCGWYICNTCGACDSDCSRNPPYDSVSSSNISSEKSDDSWIRVIIVSGVCVGGYYIYKKRNDK